MSHYWEDQSKACVQPGGVILGGLAGNSEDPAFRTLIGSPLIDNSDHVTARKGQV